MISKIFRTLFTLFLFSFTTAALLFIFIFTTQPGLYFALSVAKAFIPGQLTFSSVQGELASEFTLEKVHYQYQETSIALDAVTIRWQPIQLIKREIVLDALNIQGYGVTLTAQGVIDFQSSPEANFKIHLADKANTQLNGDFYLLANQESIALQGQLASPFVADIDVSAQKNQQNHWQAQLSIENLLLDTGPLPVQAERILLFWDGQQLQLATDAVTVDGHPLALSGSVGQQWDLQWQLKSFVLQDIHADLAGSFTVSGLIKGPLKQPTLALDLDIKSPELASPINLHLDLPIDIQNLQSITIDGSVTVNETQLNVQGDANLTGDQPTAHLSIKGEDIQLLDSERYNVIINPDLTLRYVDDKLFIEGTITIPKATLRPVDFSTTLEIPEETIFVDETSHATAELPVYLRISFILGDDVTINYLGATGKVIGDLTIIDIPKSITRANGEISLVEGKYTAYGQQLDIEYGRLIYTGNPLDNPRLDVRASRTIKTSASYASPISGQTFTGSNLRSSNFSEQTIKVGVDISGDAYDPVAVLFSEPDDLSDGDILSFLLLGQPLAQTAESNDSSRNSELLVNAINVLQFSSPQARALTNQLEDTFGVDIGFATEAAYDNGNNRVSRTAALVLGKQLSPRLFISYSIDILRRNGDIFRARYALSKHWLVQVETDGTDNAIDLLYVIEKD